MGSVPTLKADRRQRKAAKRAAARAAKLNGPIVTRLVDPATIEIDAKAHEQAIWYREHRGI